MIKDRLSGPGAEYALNVLSEKRKEVSTKQTDGESDLTGSVEAEQSAESVGNSVNATTAQTPGNAD